MDNGDDEELLDGALLREIELLTELMVAASRSHEPMSLTEVDDVLGVSSPGAGAGGVSCLIAPVLEPGEPDLAIPA